MTSHGSAAGGRIVTAVALYGPKDSPLREFFPGLQSLLAEHVGTGFRPYSLEQIHGTLIILTGVPDPATGALVNQRLLERSGIARKMDLGRAMDILTAHLATPVRVRIGGWRPRDPALFRSRGLHPYQRSFSVQDGAFVLVGWPAAALAGNGRPLDELRRGMNAAGVFHRYHDGETDIDDDFHLVLGHHDGAPARRLERAVQAVREHLAGHPVEFDIGLGQAAIVAARTPTLRPARFVSRLPVDQATLRSLMR
jgi:hypothetical protein